MHFWVSSRHRQLPGTHIVYIVYAVPLQSTSLQSVIQDLLDNKSQPHVTLHTEENSLKASIEKTTNLNYIPVPPPPTIHLYLHRNPPFLHSHFLSTTSQSGPPANPKTHSTHCHFCKKTLFIASTHSVFPNRKTTSPSTCLICIMRKTP